MNKIKNIALKVPRKLGEETRRILLERNLLRTDLRIKRNQEYLYLPLIREDDNLPNLPVVVKEFQLQEKRNIYYKDLLPVEIRCQLPTSYDVIGDIILIKLPETLLEYKKDIGDALLKANPHIKTVCRVEAVRGELRVRDIEIIAGEKRTETIHREYGVKLYVDVAKTFFSPRLANERRRISKLVREGETIIDMFTGVAPFPVMIAKYSHPKKIYAVDKNKEAVFLAKKNVKVNKVEGIVEVLLEDARNLPNIVEEKADRVIMNLPFSAYKFLKEALQIIKSTAIIHYYDILREEHIEERKKRLQEEASKQGFMLEFTNINKIKTYAPREFYIGMDITAYEKADVA
ncbi:MAG TPA: class I SAM-dependent methyltransferase family protein [Thermoplasmatales archaeon]|nr:class I SAM-dependent methyltransferase family protein [Thermoplasmatales archaeon]